MIRSTVLAFCFLLLVRSATAQGGAPPAPQISSSFKEAVDYVLKNGTSGEVGVPFCARFAIDCGGHPWQAKLAASNSTDRKNLAVGTAAGQVVVVILRQDNDKATSEIYVCDAFGNLARAYRTVNNNAPILSNDEKIKATFETEKRWWIKWQQWESCSADVGGAHGIGADAKIAACTARIESGVESAHNLSVAFINRSRGYGAQHDTDKQMRDLDHAVKADPNFDVAWSESCSAHSWVSHDSDRAMQECSKALALNPNSASAWTFRGDIFLRLRKFDEAIQDYNHAIELDPKWMWPWDNRGEAYFRLNQIDRATQDFEEVIRLNPDYAMGFLDRGIARLKKKELDLALSDFQTGLKVDPKCASCLIGLGLVKRSRGDVKGGDADIAAAKAMDPRAPELFEEDGFQIP